MGFGDAYINIQLLTQSILNTPFFYDTSTHRLIPNPRVKSRWNLTGWHLIQACGVAILCYSIYRVKQLGDQSSRGERVNPEEGVLYAVVSSMVIQQLVISYTMERDPPGFTYITSELFRVVGVLHRGWPSSNRLPDIPELMGYSLALGFWLFPFLGALFPLIKDYDPLNTLLDGVLPSVPRRALASVLYLVLIFSGINMVSSFLLLIMTCCHGLEKMTKMNLVLSCHQAHYSPGSGLTRLEKMVETGVKLVFRVWDRIRIIPGRRERNRKKDRWVDYANQCRVVVMSPPPLGGDPGPTLEANFTRSLSLHRELYMLISASNGNVNALLPIMLAVGITFMVGFNVGMIILLADQHHPEFSVLLFLGIMTLDVCIAILTMFLCHRAALPLDYSSQMIHHWRGRLMGKVERKQAKAMIATAFRMGPFFVIDNMTALDVMDVVLINTVNVLLG